jgi:hypothetical protein
MLLNPDAVPLSLKLLMMTPPPAPPALSADLRLASTCSWRGAFSRTILASMPRRRGCAPYSLYTHSVTALRGAKPAEVWLSEISMSVQWQRAPSSGTKRQHGTSCYAADEDAMLCICRGGTNCQTIPGLVAPVQLAQKPSRGCLQWHLSECMGFCLKHVPNSY